MFVQNEVSEWMGRGVDESRVGEAVAEAIKQTGFVRDEGSGQVISSKWWSSVTAGAVSVRGSFDGKPSILKIQLVEPTTRESDMMVCFATAFQGSGVRPPHMYTTLPPSSLWQGEVVVMEDITPFRIQTAGQFFEGYCRYRHQLKLIRPWIKTLRGDAALRILRSFDRFRTIRRHLYPEGNWLTPDDELLLDEGIATLSRVYESVPLTFMHGHFSARDMYMVNGEVVLLSNLYWSWRPPLYDLVFGFHWKRLDVIGEQREQIDQESQQWEVVMEQQVNEREWKWYMAARLERALATLNLDGAELFRIHSEYLPLVRQEIVHFQSQLETE